MAFRQARVSVASIPGNSTGKALTFHYSSVPMVADPSLDGGADATGTFTADGTGTVDLFASP